MLLDPVCSTFSQVLLSLKCVARDRDRKLKGLIVWLTVQVDACIAITISKL